MRWVAKTRTVRIATQDGDSTYHSVEDVPEQLRQLVMKTLEGPNAQTVLIANQEAYERLEVQFRKLPDMEPVAHEADGEGQRPALRWFRTAVLWRWAVAGAVSLPLALWLLWVWVIRNGTS